MSDATRRATERQAAAGDALAAARLLVERVRAGELAPARLELAAHLGDPAACVALGRAPDPITLHAGSLGVRGQLDQPATSALRAWDRQLTLLAAGRDARARILLAAIAAAEPAWAAEREGDASLRAGLAAARRGLDRGALLDADRAAIDALVDLPREPTDLRWALRSALDLAGLRDDRARGTPAQRDDRKTEALVTAARVHGDLGSFFAALRDDLLPWLLRGPA